MKKVLEYLTDLTNNNDREWYHTNKERYKQANTEFEHFIGDLIIAIGEFDNSVLRHAPKDLTFKMVRDTRYSHDKSPYNPTFRAHIASMGKLPIPVGYYIAIAPGNRSFIGGGLFASMFNDATTMIRNYITANGAELEAIVSEIVFAEHFTVKGETLKNVPKGYDPAHPKADYLKNKSWYLEYPVSDEEVTNGNRFVVQAALLFKYMKPFNDYLNTALKEFTMPSR
jgi:uncharacterized protein (TIGR02453 family)